MSDRLRCIVFDLDDTLYLERDYVRSGFAAVGAYVRDTLEVEGFQDLAWEEFEAGARGDIFDRVLQRLGIGAGSDLVQELVNAYRSHEPDICLQPDAAECIGQLVGRVKLGLITDGPLASQRAKVHALEIDQEFDEIIFTAELGPGFGKPHPRAFAEMQRRLNSEASECIYVADNPAKDFVGPNLLGWKTVRVRRPEGLYSLEDSGEDVDTEILRLGRKHLIGEPGSGPEEW